METSEKVSRIQALLEDMKAQDIVTIDVERSVLADSFIVATASSGTHAKAVLDRLHVGMKDAGCDVSHQEVDTGREWIILDFGDIVVHIFQEGARRRYDLEALWGGVKAARSEGAEAPEAKKARKGSAVRRGPLTAAELRDEAAGSNGKRKPMTRPTGARAPAKAKKGGAGMKPGKRKPAPTKRKSPGSRSSPPRKAARPASGKKAGPRRPARDRV